MAPIITSYPHPDNWKWVIVCDDASWTYMLRHTGWNGNRPNSQYCRQCHAEKQREYRAAAKMFGVDRNSVYARLLIEAKSRIIFDAIEQAGGNCSEAAIRLGVHRITIGRLLQEAGIKAADLRKCVTSIRVESEVTAIA